MPTNLIQASPNRSLSENGNRAVLHAVRLLSILAILAAISAANLFPQSEPANLTVPNTNITQGTAAYQAIDSITTGSSFSVSNAASVAFNVTGTQSGSAITLVPGFTAIAGTAATTFHAFIGPPASTPTPVSGTQQIYTPQMTPAFQLESNGDSQPIAGGDITFLWTDSSGNIPGNIQCPVEFVISGSTMSLSLLDASPGVYTDGVCTINPAASTVSVGSDVVTVSLNITFLVVGTYTINSDAIDTAGMLAPFQAAGTWTVTAPWNFTMAAPSVSPVTVTPTGAQGSYNQTFQSINGFSGPVGLSYKYNGGSLPSGLSFSVNSLTVSGPTAITAPITVSAAQGTPAGTYPISITATGAGTNGTLTQTSSVAVVVTPPPSFTITVPSEIYTTNNSNWSGFTQTITGANGFHSPVSIAAYQYRDSSGYAFALPGPVNLSYASASWTPDSISGKVNASGMIESPSNATTGVYYYDCVATSGSLQYFFSIVVDVSSSYPATDFSLTPSSLTVSLTEGGSAFSFQATVGAVNAPSVSWSGSFTTIGTSPPGWPAGVNVSVTPSNFSTLPATATIRITAFSTAQAGTYSPSISVTATNPSNGQQVTHTIPITLIIGNVPTFTLSASPGSQTTNPQGGASYQIKVAGVNGFNGQLSFSASGLPGGSTMGFTPSLVSGSGSAVFTAAVPAGTALTTYPVTITGTSGNAAASALAYLTVPASNSSPATMVSPVPGWNLNGSAATFTWTPGVGASQYQLLGGSSPGGSDYFAVNTGGSKAASVTWPSTTQKLYITLGSLISGAWQNNPYIYAADPQSSHVVPASATPASGGNWVYNNSQEMVYTYFEANGGDDSFYKSCMASDTNVAARLISVTSTSMQIGYTANFSAIPANNEVVTCDWEGGENGSYPSVPVTGGVTVYDATPVITEVDQLSDLPLGGNAYITIWGDNFGTATNLQGITFFPCGTQGGCNPTNDISVVQSDPGNFWSPTQINVLVQSSVFASGLYYVQLNSTGASGLGFQANPQTNNGGQSNRVPAVAPAGPPAVSITRADITSDQITVSLRGGPAQAMGNLTLTLQGTAGNSSNVVLANVGNEAAGQYPFSFGRLNVPPGQYGSLVATWTVPGQAAASFTAQLAFDVLGTTRFSTYNVPNESQCMGDQAAAWIISQYTTGNTCQAFPTMLKSQFMSQTALNGTGISAGYGILKAYLASQACSLPQGGTNGNTFYEVPSVTGACSTSLMSGSSVATNPSPNPGTGQWVCGDRVLLVNTSGQTDSTKVVQDACPACNTAANNSHIDTYSSSPACVPGTLGDYGNFFSIRLR